MTNKEYLTAVLGRFGLTEADIDLILVEGELDPDANVDTGEAKLVIYYAIPWMMAGLQDVTEGGYSIKWNIEGLKLWFSALAAELGLEDTLTLKPTVKDASFRW